MILLIRFLLVFGAIIGILNAECIINSLDYPTILEGYSALNFKKPLFLSENKDFLYPNDLTLNAIVLEKDTTIFMCCPYPDHCRHVKCLDGSSFIDLDDSQEIISNINQEMCHDVFKGSDTRIGYTEFCGETMTYEIQFQLLFSGVSKNLTLYTVCFDEENMLTAYVSQELHKDQLIGPPNLRWENDWDYDKNIFQKNPNALYKKDIQAQAISEQCSAASEWVNPGPGTDFFSRGHHIPDSDYGLLPQKRLTYNMLNAAPQWQKYNQGQWLHVEYSMRKLVQATDINYEIVTGNWEIIKCPETDSDMYLYNPSDIERHDRISIPKIYYKIINREIFIAISNHPTMELDELENDEEYHLCPGIDICDRLETLEQDDPLYWFKESGFKCNKKNQATGFTYACLYNDLLRKKINLFH